MIKYPKRDLRYPEWQTASILRFTGFVLIIASWCGLAALVLVNRDDFDRYLAPVDFERVPALEGQKVVVTGTLHADGKPLTSRDGGSYALQEVYVYEDHRERKKWTRIELLDVLRPDRVWLKDERGRKLLILPAEISREFFGDLPAEFLDGNYAQTRAGQKLSPEFDAELAQALKHTQYNPPHVEVLAIPEGARVSVGGYVGKDDDNGTFIYSPNSRFWITTKTQGDFVKQLCGWILLCVLVFVAGLFLALRRPVSANP